MEKINGLILQLDKAILISLAQDGESFFLWVEVIEVKGCDLAGPCPRIKEEMEEGIIPEALVCFEINGFEHLQ